MPLQPGTRLGPYEIAAAIGAGGMGEVYRARDTALNRDVAVKVLPEALAEDPDRLGRFQREAEALAALNHPNIAQVYGLEKSGLTPAIVMELVEGPTLADRIETGPIPLDEAVAVARQIADALESAHEAGIIHRDLKPANIKVTDEGVVKVLDFGLAKSIAQPVESAAAMTDSPTMTMRATQLGIVLGTAAYMAPEQAKGKRVDKRIDVWAFGVVLFEMLSGRRPFEGDDVTEVMASVVKLEPNWDALPANAPPLIRTLIERCLQKDPRQRVRDIGDVRLVLDGAFDSSADRQEAGAARTLRFWQRPGPVALGALALVAATSFLVVNLGREPDRGLGPVGQYVDVTPFEAPFWDFAIAPDGARVAVVVGDLLHVRDRAATDSPGTPLEGTDGAHSPFFSPAGDWIGFFADGVLKRVPVSGGAPIDVVRMGRSSVFEAAAWVSDNTIIYTDAGALSRVSVASGESESLTTLDLAHQENAHAHPLVLPGGRTVIFTIGTGTGSRLARLSLQTGEVTRLWPDGAGPNGSQAQYLDGGYLVFSEEGDLRLAPIDPETGQIRGDVVPVLDGVALANRGGVDSTAFRVSPSGDLMYVRSDADQGLEEPVWVGRDGVPTPIDMEPARYTARGLVISPDDRYVAAPMAGLDSEKPGEVWLLDLPTFERIRRIPGAGADYSPAWSPDGDRLVFTRQGNVYEWALSGGGDPQPVLELGEWLRQPAWSHDGQFLAGQYGRGHNGLWVMSRDGRVDIIEAVPTTTAAYFSPVDNVLAYGATVAGRSQIRLRRYPGDETLLVAAGMSPVWSRDGARLFFIDDGKMRTVEVQTTPALATGQVETLWDLPANVRTEFDVARDGRFLMLRSTSSAASSDLRVYLTINWIDDLRSRGLVR